MKKEYDFTNAEQGQFYVPIEELDIPIYFDEEVKILPTIDKQGNSKYFYISNEINNKDFKVSIFDNKKFQGDFFQFSVIKKNEIWKVQNMFAHVGKYREQGLPEALIMYVKEQLNQPIYSSSIIHIGDDYLSVEGKKVWERLVHKNQAILDDARYRYRYKTL